MLPFFEEKLLESDDVLFLHGACHIFALALSERFGYPLRMVRNITETPPNGATHVFCYYDESRGVDACGLFTVRQLFYDMGWPSSQYVTAVINSNLQPYCTTTSGGGLYMEPSFVAKARSRADKLIDRFPDHYSGHLSQSVPGLQRRHIVDCKSLFNETPTKNA